jgi:hypothetical protein
MANSVPTNGGKNTTTGGSKDTTTPTDGVKPGTPTKGETPSKYVFGDSKSAEMKQSVAQITAANSGSEGSTKRTGEINTATMAKVGKQYQLPKGMGTGVKLGKK